MESYDKPKRRKVLLFVFAITVFVLSALISAGYFIFFNPVEKIENALLNFNYSGQQKPQPTTCLLSQQLKYVYYSGSDPNWKINNKFGLYIYAEDKDFINIADELVNSKGGDWGYVLIPYSVKDYDSAKWGRVFNQLINKHLIPVIQLWNVDVNDYKKETRKAANFLNNFIWPIRYRYISVYNEPNDNNFWYGNANAKEYAQILNYTIDTFKGINSDFYTMNGAFNISTSNTTQHIDGFEFMKLMNDAVPGIFDKLDAWASHPYPQPNFSGSPYDTGRMGIRAYESELDYLKNEIGVKKNLPVFITETGWAHAEGESYDNSFLTDDIVAKYFKIAYEEFWLKDDRVRAVMPFTVIYDSPFDHFSWVNEDKVPYLHYDVVKSIKKVAGEPPKYESGGTTSPNCEY